MALSPRKDEEYNSDYVGNIESDPPSCFDQLLVEWKDLLFQELDQDEDNSWTQSKILTPFVLDINNPYLYLVRMIKKIATCLWGDTECFSFLPKTIWYKYGFTCFSMKEKQSIGHCHLIQWKNITSSVDGKNYIWKAAVYNPCIDVQRTTRLCQKFYRFIIKVHQEDKYTHLYNNDCSLRCSHTLHVGFEKGQSDIIPIEYKILIHKNSNPVYDYLKHYGRMRATNLCSSGVSSKLYFDSKFGFEEFLPFEPMGRITVLKVNGIFESREHGTRRISTSKDGILAFLTKAPPEGYDNDRMNIGVNSTDRTENNGRSTTYTWYYIGCCIDIVVQYYLWIWKYHTEYTRVYSLWSLAEGLTQCLFWCWLRRANEPISTVDSNILIL